MTTFDSRAVFVKGTINGQTIAGGDVAGTDDPGLMDKVPTHTHPTDAHTHNLVSNTIVGSRGTPTGSTAIAMFLNTNDPDETFMAVGGGPANVHLSSSASPNTQANTGAANYTPNFAAAIACQLDV